MPILEAIAVTVLVYYTAAQFLVPRGTATAARRLWFTPPFYREVPTSSLAGTSETAGAGSGGVRTFAVLAGVMAAACGVLAVPTAYLARVVTFDGKGYCEIDLSPLVAAGSGAAAIQTAVSVYYLAYSAVLSYWLPLLVSDSSTQNLLNASAPQTASGKVINARSETTSLMRSRATDVSRFMDCAFVTQLYVHVHNVILYNKNVKGAIGSVKFLSVPPIRKFTNPENLWKKSNFSRSKIGSFTN